MQKRTKVDCNWQGHGDGQAETTEPVPRSQQTGRHVFWRKTTRRGQETTTTKYTITTEGLRIQTVWNSEVAQVLPSAGSHQRRDLNYTG